MGMSPEEIQGAAGPVPKEAFINRTDRRGRRWGCYAGRFRREPPRATGAPSPPQPRVVVLVAVAHSLGWVARRSAASHTSGVALPVSPSRR